MVLGAKKSEKSLSGKATNSQYAYQNANGQENQNMDESKMTTQLLNSNRLYFKQECQCCSPSFLKLSLHLFNAVFFFTGITLTGVGVWTLLQKHPSLVLLTSGLYDLTAYILILAGVLVLVVTLVGCCGISRESHSIVFTYSLLLSVIFLAEVGAGVLAYLYRESLSHELSATLSIKFHQEYGVENSTTIAVDHIQARFVTSESELGSFFILWPSIFRMKCCGVNNFEDWKGSSWWDLPIRQSNRVPDSCCISPSQGCGTSDHPSNIRYTGCIESICKIAGDHLVIVGAVALGICLFQLMGTLLACILQCKLKDLAYYG